MQHAKVVSGESWNMQHPGREAAGRRVKFVHNGQQHIGVLIAAVAGDERAAPAWLVRRDDGRTAAFPGAPWRLLPVLPETAYREPQRPGPNGKVFLQFC